MCVSQYPFLPDRGVGNLLSIGNRARPRDSKRGFSNAPFKVEYATINVSDLEKFEDGAVVTPELLKEMGIVKNQLAGIKVLGNGELTKKVTVKAAKFSKTAVEKIEKIGGKAEVI